MSSASSIVGCLRAAPLFSGVRPEQVEALARTARRRSLRRGESFFRAGAEPDQVIVVTRGLVKMVRPSGEGDVILGVFGPRDAIGLIAVLQRCPYPADSMALTEHAEAISLSASHLLGAMAEEPMLALAAGRALSYHACVLQLKIDVMTAGQVAQRIASLLLNLTERFGDELEDASWVLPVALNRTELSCLVGARVETTIRVLSGWQKRGLVTTHEDGFVIHDRAALASAAFGEPAAAAA